VLERGREGEIYNIGGSRALPNIEIVRKILRATGRNESAIEYVRDRPGHDRRYAITSEKTARETGWQPRIGFEEGLESTISWYSQNRAWIERVKSGEYQNYYERNYRDRELELERLRKP
jgi:dTDP-glucose 4,6-dehydratase